MNITFSNIRIELNGLEKKIRLGIRSLPRKKGQAKLAALLLEETVSKEIDSVSESPSFDVGKEAEQRIMDLEQELQFTKE